MQFLFLLPFLVSLASANIMNNVLFKVLTQGMDPFSRAMWKNNLGAEFFDSDSSSAASAGPMGSYATDAISEIIVQSMFNPKRQGAQGPAQWGSSPPQPAFSHSSPNLASSNVIAASAMNPSKGSNLVNPYSSASFAMNPSWSSSSGNNVVSPAAPVPTGLAVTNPSSPASTNTDDSGPTQTSFSSGNSGLTGSSSSSMAIQDNFFQYFMMMRMLEMMEMF